MIVFTQEWQVQRYVGYCLEVTVFVQICFADLVDLLLSCLR